MNDAVTLRAWVIDTVHAPVPRARISAQIMAIGVRETVQPPSATWSPSLTNDAASVSDMTLSCRLRSRAAVFSLRSKYDCLKTSSPSVQAVRRLGNHSDIVRTPGSESNVREVYDECAELERDPRKTILNQFSDFGNYLAHYLCTGRALGQIFEALRQSNPDLNLAAFLAGSGSAGTLGAGDHLSQRDPGPIANRRWGRGVRTGKQLHERGADRRRHTLSGLHFDRSSSGRRRR